VEQFITGYRKTAMVQGEFIESVRVPRLLPGQAFHAYKLSKRFDQDISTLVAAFRLQVEDGIVKQVRAAYGGMASQAKRASAVEAKLAGRPWNAVALDGIDAVLAQDFQPIDDHRGKAAYRLRAAANLLRRLQMETTTTGDAALRLESL
jgi:xanthine dehydrogenase small subunit